MLGHQNCEMVGRVSEICVFVLLDREKENYLHYKQSFDGRSISAIEPFIPTCNSCLFFFNNNIRCWTHQPQYALSAVSIFLEVI